MNNNDREDRWEVPVLGAAMLVPRSIVLRAVSGRVLLAAPPDEVIIPDAQIDVFRAAARTALVVAQRQRGGPDDD